MSDLNALVERIEAGSGSDRTADGLIAARTLPARPDGWLPWVCNGGYVLTPTGEKPLPGHGQFVAAPPYTASIDAAVALVERVLPGRSAEILREALSALGKKHRWHINLQRPGQIDELPRLVVAATLRALSHADHERKE